MAKTKKYYWIYTHDYMDLKPEREMHEVYDGRLQEYLWQLRQCVNGTVTLDRECTEEEVKKVLGE